MKRDHILVTGANGFVGHELCVELIKLGFQVKAASRVDGTPNISGCKITKVSPIDSHTDWTAALSGVNTVIHLAARVHVMNDTTADPLEEFRKVNLHGTMNLAEQAVNTGVKRFVYVSSIKVNGEYTKGNKPFTEKSLVNPQDDYAISKLEAERALLSLAEETGMEVVIIRPPLIYGPGVKANFLKLMRLVDRSLPLPLGGISNARSMIFLGNFVSALIACATHNNAANNIYLVSDGEDISTPQLIVEISNALNTNDRIFNFPVSLIYLAAKLLGKSASVQRLTQSLKVDSAKIRNELGWQPPFTLKEGLKITSAWYKQSPD